MLLTTLVFISGTILLLSAAVPGILSRLKIAQEFLALLIMHISHQLTVAAGIMLLGLCRGIEYKVKGAFHLALVVLMSAALFSVFKGFDYEEAIFLFIVTALLFASEKQFYRESYVLTWGKALFDGTVVILITVMYVSIGYANLPTAKFHIPASLQSYMITDYRDLFYSAIIGILIAIAIFVVGNRIQRPKKMERIASIHQEKKIKEHLERYTGTEFSHLIFLHDKYEWWNEDQTVLLTYQTYADKIVVLGNPVGDETNFFVAFEAFLGTADLYGYTPVFYEVNPTILPALHEQGFGFFKLGEEAFVDLDSFSLAGKKMKGNRAVKNKFEREHFSVELLSPSYSSEILHELEDVSTKWLQGRAERGFSLGFFDERYCDTSNIAVLRDEEGIIGFASLMPM